MDDSSKEKDSVVKEGSETLGAWLKNQRQKRNISLEEIAAVTKIHIAQLRYLEEDQMEHLPAPAFVRGFLVSYSRHLGLDETEVMTRYRATQGEATSLEDPLLLKGSIAARSASEPRVRVVRSPSLAAAPNRNLEANQNKFPDIRTIAIAAGVILLVALVVVLISIGKKASKKTKPAPSPVAALVEKNSERVGEKTVERPEVIPPRVEKTVGKKESSSAPASAEPVAAKKYQMEIKAIEPSWINVRSDDGGSQGLLLKAGSLNPFSANRRIVLSLSDAGAVEIKWNGAVYGAPGFRGDVKSITLPDELSTLTLKAASAPKTARVRKAAPPPAPAEAVVAPAPLPGPQPAPAAASSVHP